MESIWTKTAAIQTRPPLTGDLTVEAAVIGAGLAGVLTAFFLQQRNVSVIVLEADKIGSGQTKNTTAKITLQHDLIYHKLIKDLGTEKAMQYARANALAIRDYRQIINEKSIDCSLKECPAYLYTQLQESIEKLERETDAAKALGIHAELTTQTTLPFDVAGAVKFHEQANFNPLAFLKAVSNGLDIFEHTKAMEVEDNRILTERGIVTAKHLVFATHFPFVNIPGYYFARMHQERSYVLALENAAGLDGMYLGADSESLSFRNFGETLLLGGGGHRTGQNSTGGRYAFLREKARQFYPQSTELLHWSAQDCMTLDGVPYIGQFSPAHPNWYVATGFGKWGMTTGMAAARLIADKITGMENPYAPVFSPLRFTPSSSVKTLFSDMGHAVKGLSKQVFHLPKAELEALPVGHGGVVACDGQKAGVYKEDAQTIHLVSTRCPHLGCQVEWNPDEKSWDCPCHGSRFDYKGGLIDNPAQNNLERGENE